MLAQHFLHLFATEMGLEPPGLSTDALSVLACYDFPGNIRKLKNIIERALIESRGGDILPTHLHLAQALGESATPAGEAATVEALPVTYHAAEMAVVKRALEQSNGNVSAAATVKP